MKQNTTGSGGRTTGQANYQGSRNSKKLMKSMLPSIKLKPVKKAQKGGPATGRGVAGNKPPKKGK